jgi:hypothetical protein
VLPLRLDAASGVAEVQRLSGALEFRGRLELSDAVALFVRTGAGVSRYGLTARAVPGFHAKQNTHSSAFFVLGFGAEYWLSNNLGLFLSPQLSMALNAPVVRFVGEATEPLERPMLGLGAGMVVATGH